MPDLEKRARCVPRWHPTRDPVSDLLPVPVPLARRLGARDRALLEPLGLRQHRDDRRAPLPPHGKHLGRPVVLGSDRSRSRPSKRTISSHPPHATARRPDASAFAVLANVPPPPRLVCHLEPIRVRRGPARWSSGVRQGSVEDQAELRSRCTDRAEKTAKKAHRSQCPTDRVRYNESSVRPCMRSSRFRKCLSKGPGTARRRGA